MKVSDIIIYIMKIMWRHLKKICLSPFRLDAFHFTRLNQPLKYTALLHYSYIPITHKKLHVSVVQIYAQIYAPTASCFLIQQKRQRPFNVLISQLLFLEKSLPSIFVILKTHSVSSLKQASWSFVNGQISYINSWKPSCLSSRYMLRGSFFLKSLQLTYVFRKFDK